MIPSVWIRTHPHEEQAEILCLSRFNIRYLENGSPRPAPHTTNQYLRQTTSDEYFTSCHKAAVIGVREEGHSSPCPASRNLPDRGFCARYTLKAGVPMEPVVDPGHSRDDSADLGPTRLLANICQNAHYPLAGDSITGPIRTRSFHFEVFTPFTISHTHVANSPMKAGSTMAGNILPASEG